MRSKTTEHHRVNRTDTSTGEHRKRSFSNHGHVNQHHVALADSQRLHDGGSTLDFSLQLAIAPDFFYGRCIGGFG